MGYDEYSKDYGKRSNALVFLHKVQHSYIYIVHKTCIMNFYINLNKYSYEFEVVSLGNLV